MAASLARSVLGPPAPGRALVAGACACAAPTATQSIAATNRTCFMAPPRSAVDGAARASAVPPLLPPLSGGQQGRLLVLRLLVVRDQRGSPRSSLTTNNLTTSNLPRRN